MDYVSVLGAQIGPSDLALGEGCLGTGARGLLGIRQWRDLPACTFFPLRPTRTGGIWALSPWQMLV